MFSCSRVVRGPFRLLTGSRFNENPNPALALGRAHASWFLVYSMRPHVDPTRAVMCLNFVVPGDRHSVGALSPAGRPIFTVGGATGYRVLDTLLSLRDEYGSSPIAVAKEHTSKRDIQELFENLDTNPHMLLADIEVLLSESELMQACAHCGKWETMHGPRFLRCSGCKSRYYCSDECQERDWKPQYHEGECGLLRAGKAYEAESRRKLHNNGWYFDYAEPGDQQLLVDSGIHTYERAMRELDVEELAYGRHYPPHDVHPLPRRALPPPWCGDEPESEYPPGFVPTGDPTVDAHIHDEYCRRMHCDEIVLDPPMVPTPDSISLDALPKYPHLPKTPGFVPTGDPVLDEGSLYEHLRKNGTWWQRKKLRKISSARWKSLKSRQQLAAERQARWDEVRRLAKDADESDPNVAEGD